MLEQNQNISLTGEEALDALREIEFILISLHKMGSYYAEKPGSTEEYRRATTNFIDDCAITQRLAKVRTIISENFDDALGDDDMDDVERYCSDLKFWAPDQPLNKKEQDQDKEVIEFSGGTIQQITCKHNQILVIVTNLQHEYSLITFHNSLAFEGTGALGAETGGIYEEKDSDRPQDVKHMRKHEKRYCFRASKNEENIFTVTADAYSIEKI